MSETVGIVGGGPAGLAAAYMLSQNPKFKVYIFDKNVQMGMDSQSITLEFPQQGLPFIAANAGAATASQHRIDVPLRSFSPGYYPCLAKMYKHCGIQAQPTAHSITFSVHGPTLESVSPMVSYTTISILGYEVIIPDQHLDLAVQARLMADFTRFMFISAYHYDTNTLGKFSSINIRQYLSQTGYGIEFQDYLLIPFLVTVATCSTKSAREYPASVVLDFMARNHSVHRGLSILLISD